MCNCTLEGKVKPFYFSSWLVFDLHLVAFLVLQRLPSWQYREYKPRFLPFLVGEGFLNRSRELVWKDCSCTFENTQVQSAIMYDTKVLEVSQRNYYYGNIINKVKLNLKSWCWIWPQMTWRPWSKLGLEFGSKTWPKWSFRNT